MTITGTRGLVAGLAALAAAAATPVAAQTLAIATNPQGSAYYAVGSAVAAVVTDEGEVRMLVQPTSGSSENIQLLQNGDVEFTVQNTVDLAWAHAGDVAYEGNPHPDIRLVSAMFQFPIGIAVPADSDIRSIEDLAGKRMPSEYTSHLTIRHIQDAILATAGLSSDDIEGLPVTNYVEGMQALADGRVDAAVVGPTSGKAREIDSQLSNEGGIRLLPIPETDEALAAMNREFPGSQHHTLSADRELPGASEDVNVMAWSGFVATNANVPDDVVRAVTAAIAHNAQTLREATPTLSRFSTDLMVEPHPVPYHDGAAAYYRENGMMN